MDRLQPILTALMPFALVLILAFIAFKAFQWLNRGQIKKWEGAVDDSRKSVELQTEILAELKAVKEILEKK